MSSIIKIERKYDKISLIKNGASVSFSFEPSSEIIYVIVPKDFEDAKQDITPLSTKCRILQNAPEHDVNECIPFDTFKAYVHASKSLNPDYTSNSDKSIYQCTVAVKHRINVGTSETAKQYTSTLSEKRFFKACIDDFECLERPELENLKDLQIVSDDIGNAKLYTCRECAVPTTILHPGLLTEIPNSWTDVADTNRGVSSHPVVTIKDTVEKPSPVAVATVSGKTTNNLLRITDPQTGNTYYARVPNHEAPPVRASLSRSRPSHRNVGRIEPVLRLSDIPEEAENQSEYENNSIETPPANEDTAITIQNSSTLVSREYNFEQSLHSMTLDIISVYLKGQKMLYIEAKVYCEQHLYALMLPAIIITAVCSVVSVSLNSYWFGGIIVSCFTACNSCILSLVTYLKLDAKAEAHKMTAYSFEKLQSMCEFSSGRILFADKHLTLLKLMEEIGTNVKDIKEKNQFILPEAIRHRFPYLYSTNVFAEVKQIQNTELILINEMQNLIEAGKNLKKDIDMGTVTDVSKYEDIVKHQNIAFKELMNFRKQYMEIDNKFKKEIDDNIGRTRTERLNCCQWLKN